MHKLGFPSMKSLDQFKSLSGSVSGSARNLSLSSRPSSDSLSSGSFANLKLTAEKLIKEQASVKTDLEIANSKLKKSMEIISALEEKLQSAFNENAKLRVKQKEDEKLWKGLESKFSSTKTVCDQLTETLQHLAGLVQDAEKDKQFFESELLANSNVIDNLNQRLNDLSVKLASAEETVRNREKKLGELKLEKEERNRIYLEEQCRNANLIEEKDTMIRRFEATIEANKLAAESLNSKLEKMHHELCQREDEIKHFIATQENWKKEKCELQFSSNDLANKLDTSHLEIKNLESFVHILAAKLIELDKQNLIFSEKFDLLNSLYDTCFKLVNVERELVTKHAQKQYEQLHDKFLHVESEKDALESVNHELNNKIIELQKAQESIMAQLSEEGCLAREKIQRLETEAETLLSKKNETDMLVSKLEETIDTLSESSRTSEIKMHDLLLKFSGLEIEKKNVDDKLLEEERKNADNISAWQMEREKHEQQIDSLEKQVAQLCITIEEKEQLLLEYKDREKKLEDKITESQSLLSSAESKLVEAKKQYDVMLESKQMELSRHLKEISQRNDQAINDIRKNYEMEKLEAVNLEKQKAEKLVLELESKCDQKLAECKEESGLLLVRVQEEHAALVLGIQQEHDTKEMSVKAAHTEELKRTQLIAENEMREKTIQLRNEHDVQMKALRTEHEDECKRLQEELNLQKTKEDRQRALLQLQWKVMSDKPRNDQEVTSKEEYSVSSIKMRDPAGGKRSQCLPTRLESREKDLPFPRQTQTPVSKILKRVDNANTGSVMSISKHHKKVTHREYEVETNDGRTITKRRKTRIMFEDPSKHKKMNTPKAGRTPRTALKGIKGVDRSHPSNIGDLFSEGSLNPYADDPYAFG
ncbi:synaptonemal complex protein 2-like [Euphorbia lathyris]|uniref:synaptonemal complex protein 2-like n=1 Tax=Euphorbia lathyris TaxID=212925 RepID=UPI003313DAC7